MNLFRSYKNKTDEQLMVFVQHGDHRAFSEVYDRYAGRMKAFFYRMLWSNGDKAEDFVQDLFTKLIERPELFHSNKPFAPWIFKIASNMCKNAYRKRKFEVEYLNQLEMERSENSTAGLQLDEQILTERLHVALEQMGEEKRELFLLRYQQELSIKDLAGIMCETEGTIKSRLFYIKKNLVEMLSEEKFI